MEDFCLFIDLCSLLYSREKKGNKASIGSIGNTGKSGIFINVGDTGFIGGLNVWEQNQGAAQTALNR